MSLLSQNAKMKKSSQNGTDIYNFGIPAFKSQDGTLTCPNAKNCVSGCYAKSGTYNFSNVRNAYENRLKATQSEAFIGLMIAEINLKLTQARSKGNTCLIRIHDSGDFYSKDYAKKWFLIMKHFVGDKDCKFYAYTKMISLFKDLVVPINLTLIFSFGGSEDHLINCKVDRHAKVFENETDLIEADYTDATQDDRIAAFGLNTRIGLVYHGVKNYANTTWSKVR